MPPPRDRGDVHEGVVFLQIDVAVGFAERRFRLQQLGVDQALDHDLGFRRHQEIDGLAAHDVDRAAGDGARDRKLVEIVGELLHRRIGHDRRTADHDRAGQRLAARLVLLPVGVDAGAQLHRRVHAEPLRRLELAAVVADVLDADVGILGDVVAGREIGRVVPARRRDRHRQSVERLAVLVEVLAGDHDLLARRVLDHARRDRIGDGVDPGGADVFQRLAEAGAIDARGWRQARPPAPRCRSGGPSKSVGCVNRNALRSGSGMPPRYCQRTSGCISVSLLIGSSTTTSRFFARQRQHVLVQVRIAARIRRRSVPIAIERGVQFLAGAVVHQVAHAPR